MLPLAHVGHYLWIAYLLPVVFVVAAIVKTTLSERRRGPDGDEEGGGEPAER
jgi:heme exporter protein D